MDIGESLIGSYYRSVVGCQSVTYNTFLPDKQGEIDVIAVRLETKPQVYAAEVAIHLESLNYGGYPKSAAKVSAKMRAAREFISRVYVDSVPTLEFWSPIVPKGLVALLSDLGEEHDFRLVANHEFTERIQTLVDRAREHTKVTGEPAYRMLQILTHLRGKGLKV